MRSLLVLLLVAAGPSLGEPRPVGERRGGKIPTAALDVDRPPVQGVVNLQKRKYRMAISIFKQALAVRPDAYGTQTYLGQAYASLHRCDEALPLLTPNVHRKAFTADTALLVARCFDTVGNVGEALYWADQAELLEPQRADIQAGVGWYHYINGEPDGSAMLERSLELGPTDPATLATAGLVGLYDGDIDVVESAIVELRAVPGRRLATVFFLEGLLELDLGNATKAELLFGRSFWRDKGYIPTIVYMGEAARRQGNFDECIYVLDNFGAPGPEIREARTRSIRARAQVDRGDLIAARALVDAALVEDALDPEVVASAWYLARAEGDEAAVAMWAERYALLNSSRLRTLEQLIPLGQI